jgi:DNA-directed RNA polymerase subunit M/transcription elongation factor TFIIS
MQAPFVLVFVIVLAICFTIDPTPTVAEDMTDKTIERNLYYTLLTDNNNSNNNDKNDQNKNVDIVDVKHSCPRCNSHSLTFEGLSTSEGKVVQLINCKSCSFEWQETWTLPNWFWLKSSTYLPYNHWTSER